MTQALADLLIRRANLARLAALGAKTVADARACHAEADRWLARLREAGNATR